ncbi:ribonuclease D [Salinisphaera dokdonensis CL-ES53]|uniref:Ribonuclease D n=1 Tax=Salinisphaera dokdonensis CL-ES53 TaxID=1304272 RepID=A0ABV2AXG2_9GAMM
MIPKPPEDVATITDSATLATFCDRMRERDWIVVDTEFLRESTYYPKLCLVQIADADEVGLIDVLAIDDLAPLATLLGDPAILKVFHSAEQDLEVLYQRFGVMPAPLFDTQVAAALVGLDDQMGYARLIKALLDVDLAKSHTRTDWSKRPLPPGALDYAADDVRYLAVAYHAIGQMLAERSREDWLVEDFERLVEPRRFDVDPGQAWRRIKSWHKLDVGQQQALAALTDWREREAMGADRPRRWILGDDAVVELARRRPRDADGLAAIRALPGKTASRHGDALLEALRVAGEREPAALAPQPEPPTNAEKRRIKAGMDTLGQRAEDYGIAASALASRKEIAAMVDGARDVRLLSGWRAGVAGEPVLAAIKNAEAADGSGVPDQ